MYNGIRKIYTPPYRICDELSVPSLLFERICRKELQLFPKYNLRIKQTCFVAKFEYIINVENAMEPRGCEENSKHMTAAFITTGV